MSAPLLMTKFYIPSPGKYVVSRGRLVEKLNQCLEPGIRLALVSAPAGFGKTTLISAWLAAAQAGAPDLRAAWLSIDEGDNDPVVFWTYLITALQAQQPGAGQQALEMLAAPGGDLERKLASLINDLAQMPVDCVLVLDDYHLIRSPQIHKSLAFFIEHAPPRIHLLVASRTDPPLPLALLRGRGQLLEIRLNDLRFSDDEAERYLNAGIGLNLAEPSIRALNQKTEGWVAGLQMATVALQSLSARDAASPAGQKKSADFVASFSGSNRFILDYLIEEVLNRQPAPIQQFLMRTSIVDRLCGPLCDALLEGSETAAPGAQEALEYLESSNLFIFPLDDERYWYRYHQLFADLLRKRLAQTAPDAVPALHRRAVEWHEQNGLIPSAIHHAFQLRDDQKAAALVAQVTEDMWGRGEHATLLAWMDALPEAEKGRYPHLLTFQVSMLINAGKLKEAEACIPILERYIEVALRDHPEQTDLIGKVHELHAYIASFYGDRPGVFRNAAIALQHLTREEDSGRRWGILLVLGNARLTEGNLRSAEQAFGEASEAARNARKPHMLLSGLANLAAALWMQGSLTRCEQVCQEGLRLIEQHSLERSTAAVDIYLWLGEVLRERGALAEAGPFIQKGLALALDQQFIWQAASGYQAQARLLRSLGRLAEAENAAHAAEQWAETHPVPEHIRCAGAGLLAEIWLRQGKLAQAEQLLQARQVSAQAEIAFPRQAEHLALARLLRLAGETAQAAQVLERSAAQAEAQQQAGVRISALLQRALLFHAQGDADQAMPFLERALTLAESEGYTQVFVDAGEPAAALLREALGRGIAPGCAGKLLSGFPDRTEEAETAAQPGVPGEPAGRSEPARRGEPPRHGEPPWKASTQPVLVEPLSRRELETLRLMAEGYSNKEIAVRLSISLRTVKYYSTGIYNKLGVDSRMQAVNRARELGLI